MRRSLRKLSVSVQSFLPPSLKKALNKTFSLYKSEKYDEFLDALGVDKTTKINAMLLISSVTLKYENGEYEIIHSYSDGQTHSVRFRLNEQIVRETPGGTKAFSKFVMNGTKLKEKLKFAENEIIIERDFREKNLAVSMSVNRVKCVRHYTLTPSKHSIQTETSRRQSLFKVKVEPPETPPPKSESVTDDTYTYSSSSKSTQELCF